MKMNIASNLVKEFNKEVREINKLEKKIMKFLREKKRKELHETRRDYILHYKKAERTFEGIMDFHTNLYNQINYLNNQIYKGNNKKDKTRINKIIRKLERDGKRFDKVIQKQSEVMSIHKRKKDRLVKLKI